MRFSQLIFLAYRLALLVLLAATLLVVRDLFLAFLSRPASPRRIAAFLQSLIILVPVLGPPIATLVWAAVFELQRRRLPLAGQIFVIVLIPWMLLFRKFLLSL